MQGQLDNLKAGQVAIEQQLETQRGQQNEAIKRLSQEMEVSANANLSVHQVGTP